MLLLATSSEYLLVPVDGPPGDLTRFPVSIAVVPEGSAEPAGAAYADAVWMGAEAALKVSAGDFPAGQYAVYVRVDAGTEDVRLAAGRLRVGDART